MIHNYIGTNYIIIRTDSSLKQLRKTSQCSEKYILCRVKQWRFSIISPHRISEDFLYVIQDMPRKPYPLSLLLLQFVWGWPTFRAKMPGLFAEQLTVSQPEKREYTRVIGHNIDVSIVLADGRFDQAVDVANMFTCTLFPPHRICIVYIYVSHFHCWWQCLSSSICCGSFHDCIHVCRLVSIVRLIAWHIAAAPLVASFDRSFIISIEYSYTYGASLSFWSYAECVGSLFASRFHGRWRQQVPCSSRSSCPVYVVVAPTYFPQATVTVEESWKKWRQLE